MIVDQKDGWVAFLFVLCGEEMDQAVMDEKVIRQLS